MKVDQSPIQDWVAILRPGRTRVIPARKRIFSLPAEACSPPGEMASQLAAGNVSRKGGDTGQDDDDLKTQTDRDAQR